MDINTALRAFLRTIEKSSITGAARDLGLSQPAVTKHLLNLERRVNTRLLERSSKSVRPTHQGLVLYEATRHALASIDAALEGVRLESGEIAGCLRIHAPSSLCFPHLYNMLMQFQERYPKTTSELVVENKNVDSIYENFDITIHLGKVTNQTIIARHIGWIHRILVASPEFIEKHGGIKLVEDISNVPFITTTAVVETRNILTLRNSSGDELEIPVRPILKTNTAHIVIDALLEGRGVGPAQINMVENELKHGKLIRVLPDYSAKSSEVFLTYPSTKFMRPIVREFADFIASRFRAIEGIADTGTIPKPMNWDTIPLGPDAMHRDIMRGTVCLPDEPYR